MEDIKKIIETQRQLDNLTGARNAHKTLLERFNTESLSALSYNRDLIAEISRNQISNFANSSNFHESLRLVQNSISQSALKTLRGFQNSSIQNTRKLIEETFEPFLRNDFLSNQLKASFEHLRQSLLSPYQSQKSEILRGFEQITKATTFSSLETLSKTFAQQAEIFKNEDFLRQMSTSLIGYDHFANVILNRLRDEMDKRISSALKGSLVLANEQVLRSTSVVQSYIENLDISNNTDSNLFFNREFPRINRYRIQKQELLRRDDIEEDEEYESLVIKSDSAISFEQISNCMTLIGLCNEASETTKGNTIFTLTSTLWLSAWKLMGVVPTNKNSFAIIVDCLYLMLYEGAGKDKLRFIEQGYIEKNEAELIWKIKHLRNKWLRHDIDHGKESDIKKSHQHRKEALEWFGLGKVPYSKDEFIFLHNNLMLKVEEFLKLLLERVSKFSN